LIETDQIQEKSTPEKTIRPSWLINRFIFGWLFSLALLTTVALGLDIDWAKPKVEAILGEQLHRDVKLGHLRWRLGLNGLQFLTKSLEIKEKDGDAFLKARGTNIGVAFSPLFAGQLKIKHCQIDHPEIWATKLKPSAWNFEDLINEDLEVHLIQLDSGTIHLSDQSKERLTSETLDLKDLNLKFNMPRKNKRLPLYLSLTIPHKNKTLTAADVRLDGYSNSSDSKFAHANFSLKLDVNNLSLDTLKKLATIVLDDKKFLKELEQGKNNVTGVLSLNSDLNGNFQKGFQVKLDTKIQNLLFASKQIGEIGTKSLETKGDISFNQDKFKWQNLKLKMGPFELFTNGQLAQDEKSDYQANLETKVGNLPRAVQAFDVSKLRNVEGLKTILQTATLSGNAFLKISLSGDHDTTKLLTRLEAEGLAITELIEKLAPDLAPSAALLGLSSQSTLKGNFETLPGRRLRIHKGTVQMPDSVLTVDGELDFLRDRLDINFELKELSLKQAWQSALKNQETRTIFSRAFRDLDLKQVIVDGYLQAKGQLERDKHGFNLKLKTKLKNGGIALLDRTLNVNSTNGEVEISNDRLSLNDITGKIGTSGRFSLAGNVNNISSNAPQLDLALYGNNLHFSHLGNMMGVFKLSFPTITEQHLTGRVRELSIKLTGNPSKPKVYLSAAPEDIRYRPPGLKRSLKAVSGTFLFENNNVTLEEVGLISHDLKLTTSLRIENVTGEALLRRLHVKSDGIELADIHYYLGSPVMPTSLRKAYQELLDTYKISNLHGRVYGDLVVIPKSKTDYNLEGVLGCYSVGASFLKYKLPLERISGIIAASDDELLIQDLSGHLRSTDFQLNGYVRNYKSKIPQWKTELKASIAPQEFTALTPALTDLLGKDQHITVIAQGPLGVRAQINGNPKHNDVELWAHANPENNLKIACPAFTFTQPANEELNIDGSITLEPRGLLVHNTSFHIGEAALSAQGQWYYNLPGSPITLTILSPNPVPAKILVALLDPTIDTKKMGGAIDGFIAIQGPIKHPKFTGKLALDHLSHPDFALADLTGSISTDETLWRSNPQALSAARLEISRLKLKEIVAKDINGSILVEAHETAADQLPKLPLISLRNTLVKLSNGQIKLDGLFDLDERHVSFNAFLQQIDMEEIATKLLNAPGEISGLMNGELHLSTTGGNDREMLANLAGTGAFKITNGVVARFGQLQTKLTQANLLQQGILGFNLNNLLQSVVPIRTGEFNELTSKYQIYQGVLSINELRFSGDDLRMWGAGSCNLPDGKLEMEIAGTIPRVTKSMLGGAVGELTRHITVSKLLNQITFGTLENLPSLPIIGDIASNKPRTFAFKVNSPSNDTKLVTKSIERSFKWLPNKQAASAHPVPGI
jgi:hypothetical protein